MNINIPKNNKYMLSQKEKLMILSRLQVSLQEMVKQKQKIR